MPPSLTNAAMPCRSSPYAHPVSACPLRHGLVVAVEGPACLELAVHVRQDGFARQSFLQVIVIESPTIFVKAIQA